MKTVLITSGGTIEPIDGVRGITNFATGKLGSVIAETLQNCHIFLLKILNLQCLKFNLII